MIVIHSDTGNSDNGNSDNGNSELIIMINDR